MITFEDYYKKQVEDFFKVIKVKKPKDKKLKRKINKELFNSFLLLLNKRAMLIMYLYDTKQVLPDKRYSEHMGNSSCAKENNKKEAKEILSYAMKPDHEILEKIKQYIYNARLTVSHAQNVTGLIAEDDEYVRGGNFVLQCIEDIIYEKPYIDDDDDDDD